jgi:hypothetical protein
LYEILSFFALLLCSFSLRYESFAVLTIG